MHALPYQHFRPFNVCSYICTWLNSRLPLPTTTANCPHVGFTALRLPPIANSSTRHVSCHRRRRRRNLQRANSTLCAASISQSASSRNQPQPPSSSFCQLSADEEKYLGLLIPPSDDFCHETQAPSPCFSPVRGIVRAAFVYKLACRRLIQTPARDRQLRFSSPRPRPPTLAQSDQSCSMLLIDRRVNCPAEKTDR